MNAPDRFLTTRRLTPRPAQKSRKHWSNRSLAGVRQTRYSAELHFVYKIAWAGKKIETAGEAGFAYARRARRPSMMGRTFRKNLRQEPCHPTKLREICCGSGRSAAGPQRPLPGLAECGTPPGRFEMRMLKGQPYFYSQSVCFLLGVAFVPARAPPRNWPRPRKGVFKVFRGRV